MIALGLALAAVALGGCTPLNVNENFVAVHGALLARASCSEGITTPVVTGRNYSYEALMFLDGSVLVIGTREFSGLAFYERSDGARVHARLNIGDLDTGCGGPRVYAELGLGNLQVHECFGLPPTYHVTLTVPLVTQCSGFNVSLFD